MVGTAIHEVSLIRQLQRLTEGSTGPPGLLRQARKRGSPAKRPSPAASGASGDTFREVVTSGRVGPCACRPQHPCRTTRAHWISAWAISTFLRLGNVPDVVC